MKINVMYFGLVEEAIQKKKEVVSIPEKCTVKTLNNVLLKAYPILKNITYQVAVDQNLPSEDTTLNEGAEIAILPPFAGG